MESSLEASSSLQSDTAESEVCNAAQQSAQLVRRVATVYQRRGFRFAAYLVKGWLLPRLLYRFAWGPRAWRPLRVAFAMAGYAVSRRPSPLELGVAGLLEAPGADPSAVEALVDRAHAAGVTGLDSGARLHRWRGAHYFAGRDADRRRFNARFGAALLTEQTARELVIELKARIHDGYRDYAPIDFGHGLSVGQIGATDSGTGRWDFFNGRIVGPLVAGRRVLDLGCNNGSLTLMMLRAGAREIVAVELSEAIADFARLNARILAWRDARSYRLEIITGDMRMFLADDFGRFDVITASCSLYYLPEEDMARIVRKAAGMRATLVLQANEAIHNLPASAARLRRLMEQNGYGPVRVFSAKGFARPLLVGTPPASTPRAL